MMLNQCKLDSNHSVGMMCLPNDDDAEGGVGFLFTVKPVSVVFNLWLCSSFQLLSDASHLLNNAANNELWNQTWTPWKDHR